MLLFALVAFLGGLLSILSPCSGVLLPAYFAFIFKKRNQLFLHTLIFALGVLFFALPLGIGAVYLFNFMHVWGAVVFKVLGIIFIALAVFTLTGSKLNISKPIKNNSSSILGSFVFGIFAALSIGTCTGPVLGAIATIAGITTNIYKALVLMFIYSLGILFPFILFSLSADKFAILKNIFVKGKLYTVTFLNKKYFIHSTNLVSSVILLLIGIVYLFFSGSFLAFQSLLGINLNFLLDLQDNLLNLLY